MIRKKKGVDGGFLILFCRREKNFDGTSVPSRK